MKISQISREIDFNGITTLLFDVDNTLICFDEKTVSNDYLNKLYKYFKLDIPDFIEFKEKIFKANQLMLIPSSDPNQLVLNRFLKYFSQTTNITKSEIKKRFSAFYSKEFREIHRLMTVIPFVYDMLHLAAQRFDLIAATNPHFPFIANDIRLNWANIGTKSIEWKDITSADSYTSGKPYLQYYKEILIKNDKKTQECLMIGNEPENDLIVGKLGVKTYLILKETQHSTSTLINNLEIEPNFWGTLSDFYSSLRTYYGMKQEIS